MAHRYGAVIPVRLAARSGRPRAFVWHGATYAVAQVVQTWRLMDGWWEQGNAYPARAATDRTYDRVRCPDEQYFDLYYDAVRDVWVLDRAHD